MATGLFNNVDLVSEASVTGWNLENENFDLVDWNSFDALDHQPFQSNSIWDTMSFDLSQFNQELNHIPSSSELSLMLAGPMRSPGQVNQIRSHLGNVESMQEFGEWRIMPHDSILSSSISTDFELSPIVQRSLKEISEPPLAMSKPQRSKPAARARKILERFFSIELYPDKKETETIAQRTKMSVKQVRQWFRNKRRRTTPEELSRLQDTASKGSVPLTSASVEKLDQLSGEHRGVNASNENCPVRAATSIAPQDITPRRSSTLYAASSMGSSRYSSASRVSKSSRVSKTSTSRKGKRLWEAVPQSTQKSSDPFSCTFCRRGFNSRYAWSRHEESVHVQPKSWICCPPKNVTPAFSCRSGVIWPFCDMTFKEPWTHYPEWTSHEAHMTPDSADPACHFCADAGFIPMAKEGDISARSQLDAHIMSHKLRVCADRPEQDRTFYRKEHAKQHCQSFHGVTQQISGDLLPSFVEKKLRDDLPLKTLICPFCCKQSTDWPSRVEHVAIHFKNGDRLSPIPDGKSVEVVVGSTAMKRAEADKDMLLRHPNSVRWDLRRTPMISSAMATMGPTLAVSSLADYS